MDDLATNLKVSNLTQIYDVETMKMHDLETAFVLNNMLQNSLSFTSIDWIKAFEKAIKQTPNLQYLLLQVANFPTTNVYRKLMLEVLNANLNLTFTNIDKLLRMETNSAPLNIGKMIIFTQIKIFLSRRSSYTQSQQPPCTFSGPGWKSFSICFYSIL